jgi:hypothetical protein
MTKNQKKDNIGDSMASPLVAQVGSLRMGVDQGLHISAEGSGEASIARPMTNFVKCMDVNACRQY